MTEATVKRAILESKESEAMVRMRAPRSGAWVMIPRGLVPSLVREGWKEARA